jgi:hypothetical protein
MLATQKTEPWISRGEWISLQIECVQHSFTINYIVNFTAKVFRGGSSEDLMEPILNNATLIRRGTQVQVTLQLTVRQPVCLGVELLPRLMARF